MTATNGAQRRFEMAAGFEVEAASVEELLVLLDAREGAEATSDAEAGAAEGAVRRAVFVSQLLDNKGTSYGFPFVTRWVLAGFVYGADLVSHKRIVSHEMEMPGGPPDRERPADRQAAAFDETRKAIRAHVAAKGWDVPVLEGFLRHAAREPSSAEGPS